MKELFEKCLHAEYTHTPESGEYAIQLEGHTLFLLFQWSNGREDWLNNLDFIPTSPHTLKDRRTMLTSRTRVWLGELSTPKKAYKHMSRPWFCHRGFHRVWMAMRDEIETKVEELLDARPEIDTIVCVGYSHGGALAVLATEDMAFLYDDKHRIEGYGFGAPRVLWGAIPKTVKERLRYFYIVRNVPDIVTHVPPAALGFRHVGKVVEIGEVGRYNAFTAHKASSYQTELAR